MRKYDHIIRTSYQKDLISLSAAAYSDNTKHIPHNWINITEVLNRGYGLDAKYLSDDNLHVNIKTSHLVSFFAATASASLYMNVDSGNIAISFRGTDSWEDWEDYASFDEHLRDLGPFLNSVDQFIRDQEIGTVFVTGHSLGGALVESYLKSRGDGEIAGESYFGLAVASPTATHPDPKSPDDRLLNIGIENDRVYSFRGTKGDNAVQNLFLSHNRSDDYLDLIAHDISNSYSFVFDQVLLSQFYDDTTRYSYVIVDISDVTHVDDAIENALNIFNHHDAGVSEDYLILGGNEETDYVADEKRVFSSEHDILVGALGSDTLEGFEGNDTLIGSPGLSPDGDRSIQFVGDTDVLSGGPGFDTFYGTAEQLDGDRIIDIEHGDVIHLTDISVTVDNLSVTSSGIDVSTGSKSFSILVDNADSLTYFPTASRSGDGTEILAVDLAEPQLFMYTARGIEVALSKDTTALILGENSYSLSSDENSDLVYLADRNRIYIEEVWPEYRWHNEWTIGTRRFDKIDVSTSSENLISPEVSETYLATFTAPFVGEQNYRSYDFDTEYIGENEYVTVRTLIPSSSSSEQTPVSSSAMFNQIVHLKEGVFPETYTNTDKYTGSDTSVGNDIPAVTYLESGVNIRELSYGASGEIALLIEELQSDGLLISRTQYISIFSREEFLIEATQNGSPAFTDELPKTALPEEHLILNIDLLEDGNVAVYYLDDGTRSLGIYDVSTGKVEKVSKFDPEIYQFEFLGSSGDLRQLFEDTEVTPTDTDDPGGFTEEEREAILKSLERTNFEDIEDVDTEEPEIDPPFTVPPILDYLQDLIGVDEDTSFTGDLIKAGSPSIEGLTFSLAEDGSPAFGEVVVDQGGQFTYIPSPNFNGDDAFTVDATDAVGEVHTKTVNVSVNSVDDPATARSLSLTLLEDQQITGSLTVDDPDVDNSDDLSLDLVVPSTDLFSSGYSYYLVEGRGPKHGVVEISSDGGFLYTPFENYSGSDNFTFEVDLGDGTVDQADVSLLINSVNDGPVASDAEYEVLFGEAFSAQLVAQDVDSDELEFRASPNYPTDTGALTVTGDGTFTFTPDNAKTGGAVFGFIVEDHEGATDTGFIRITYTSPNTPTDENDQPAAADNLQPVAVNASYEAIFGETVTAQLVGSDPDSDQIAFSLAPDYPANNGDLSISSDGTFTFVPSNERTGGEVFGFFVTDEEGGQDLGYVRITYKFADISENEETASPVQPVDPVDLKDIARDQASFQNEAGDFIGSSASDMIYGGSGDESFYGGRGDDNVYGRAGKDEISGGAGSDKLCGNGGSDHLRGNGGKDTLEGGAGRDKLEGNGGKDLLNGNGGWDSLDGGAGRDILVGGGGKDLLEGGAGKDEIFGGGGRDHIIGGRGNDVLTGNGGADRFIFDLSSGRDRITDFKQGQDKIQILDEETGFDELFISQVGANTLIRFGNTRVIVETDDAGEFSNSDFIF